MDAYTQDPIERTIICLFYNLLTLITALGCFAESIRRAILLVPAVVNTNSNPTLQQVYMLVQ